MPPLQTRMSLPVLCRSAGNTCAACCHGEEVGREELHLALERQTRLFGRGPLGKRLTILGLIRYEMRVRGLTGLGVALVLLLPLVGEWVCWRMKRRVVCAYLGYEDAERTRVGCMIHPTRGEGRDLRRWAFGLWRGLACGHGDWLCPAAHRYRLADWQDRREFARESAGQDWYAFGRLASRFGESEAEAVRQRE